MKKLIFFIVLVVTAVGFWSCESDDTDLLPNGGLPVDTTIQVIDPPYIEIKKFSNSWELYDTIHDINGLVLQTPWSSNGTVGTFSPDFIDVKREDGWRFVTRIFEGNRKDGRNCFILYNEITGILKLFCYCHNANLEHNNAMWYLWFHTAGNEEIKLNNTLNAAADVALPANVKVPSSSEYIVSASDAQKHRAITTGWNVAKIPLCYSPDMPKSYMLDINTFAYTQTYVKLFADFQSETTGTAVSSYRTSSIPGFKESLVKSSKEATRNWLGMLNVTNRAKIFADFATNAGLDLVADGLNLIGSSFFGLFSQQQSTNYVIELTTNTHGNLEGSLTGPMATGLPDCAVLIDEKEIGCKLGSWTLADYPTLYVHPVAAKISDKPKEDECEYRLVGTGNFKCDVILNPELEKHVISKKVECVPLYFYNVLDSLKPQTYIYPSTEGTIGAHFPNFYEGLWPLKENPVYEFNYQSPVLMNELAATGKFYGPKNLKTLNAESKGFWDYIYVPRETQYCHYKVKYNMRDIFAKVTVTLKVKYDNKISTAVMTRTYSPRIEWDPEQVRIYKDFSTEYLQSYAKYDHIVNRKE